MGLFEQKTALEKAIKDIASSSYEYASEISKYDFSRYIERFKDDELLAEILRKIARNGYDFTIQMDYLTNMYATICINRNKLEEKTIFRSLVDLYLDYPTIFLNSNSFEKVNSAFDDKRIVLEYFNYLTKNEDAMGNEANLAILIDYIAQARQYYVDDRALLASALSLINSTDPAILKYGSKNDLEKIVNAKLRDDKKANGIYDTDIHTLAEIDHKLEEMIGSSSELADLVENAKNITKDVRSTVDGAKADLRKIKTTELEEVQRKISKIISSFDEDYQKLVSQQKVGLEEERDSILADIQREAEKRKEELRAVGQGVASRISLELGRINNATSSSMRQLKEFVQNDEGVKRILQETRANDDFLERLAQVEKIASQIPEDSTVTTQKILGVNPKDTSPNNGDVTQTSTPSVVVPGIYIPKTEERKVDPKINYYFDKRIPFEDRFNQLMELKQKDIEKNNAIYHEKFDDILAILIQDLKPPYMYGPSGCGKTYMVESQMAKLLGMNVVTNGYVLYEQDIIGYTNSGTGDYVPGNFYRCYKYGDVIFLDELDNGIANATVVLNRFMGKNTSYTFPDGKEVARHPNFRIIAAGNTKGNGRTQAYNTRQKMDESVMQRMTPIEVNYDNRIEMRILRDYPDWYDFAVNFRKAIEEIPSESGEEINTTGTFTTRDAETVRTYLDDKCFGNDKIMEYEFVQTKDEDYLRKIASKMDGMSFNTAGGRKLQKLFNQTIQKKSKR